MKQILYGCGIVICILLLWSGYDTFVPHPAKEVSALTVIPEDIFGKYGLQDSKVVLSTYFRCENEMLTNLQTEAVACDIVNKLGMTSEYECEPIRDENKYIVRCVCKAKDTNAEIKVTTIETETGKHTIASHTFIDINMEIYNSIQNGESYRENIEEITDTYGNSVNRKDIYMAIISKVNGKMDSYTQQEFANAYLHKMNGKLVFEHNNDGNYSIYGYNKEFLQYVAIGKEKINLNVVFSYHEEEDKTYVHIGSPIINYDY